ncbi:MFS transporter [Alkalihalobacillus sp. LMS39]|uniref:MFS transporter n=1 Tax=Alkalihalobacillus sp. LMS39 TaxID=2924032 RepID=UPI001FB4618F|nr:MFS transporter [Alkalihalobacillus sp. LMS39]UOE94873.1 MFS transporter [Alkalihalobacillus sp. LMS39]
MTVIAEEVPNSIPEKKIIFLWSFAVWLVVMNTTMFNVALPTVMTDLALTSTTASWIISSYSIVFAIGTLTYSRLSDYIPIARLLFIGLIMVGSASIIGFFAHEFYLLLLARIFQAAGAGAVLGLGLVLASKYIPLSRRGRAMAFISSAASLGFGLGPVIGGAITEYLGWNYLFAVTAIVFFLLPFFHRLLPKEQVTRGKFDVVGALLTGVCVTSSLLFFTSFSFYVLAVTIVVAILLIIHIQKVKMPFLRPELFSHHQYAKLLYVGFIVFTLHFSTLFMMPIILTDVYKMDAARVGLIIFPGAILSAVAAQVIGRIIDRFGNMPLFLTGHGLLLISTILFSLTAQVSPLSIMFSYMFMSVGFSSLTASMSNEVTRILPAASIGSGMGMLQLCQLFGGAFGVTLSGVLLKMERGIWPGFLYQEVFFYFTIIVCTSFLTALFYRQKLNEKKSFTL